MNNYPIKYSPMPILKNNQVVAYIAARVYLLEENKRYLSTGETITKYLIFYQYNQYNQRLEMVYDNDGYCLNGYEIDYVFNDIDSCKTFIRNKNMELILNNDEIDMLHKNQSYFKKYYDLENQLLSSKIIDFNKARKRMKKYEK